MSACLAARNLKKSDRSYALSGDHADRLKPLQGADQSQADAGRRGGENGLEADS